MNRKPVSKRSNSFSTVMSRIVILVGLSTPVYTHQEASALTFKHMETSTNVNTVFQDGDGWLWFGTWSGLRKFDGYSFTSYAAVTGDRRSISHSIVTSIIQDRDGMLWIGTEGGGLNRMDRTTGRFTHYRHDPADSSSLSHDMISALTVDAAGALWIGTNGGGLNRMDQTTGRLTRYKHDPSDPLSTSHTMISAIGLGRDGIVWIGSPGGELGRMDPASATITRIRVPPPDWNLNKLQRVHSLLVNSDNTMWVGGANGLDRYDANTNSWVQYRNDPNVPNSIQRNEIRVIFLDRSQVLWVAGSGFISTLDATDQGFNLYRSLSREPDSRNSVERIHTPEKPHRRQDDVITGGIYEDGEGALWLGSQAGVIKFDRAKNQVTKWSHRPDDDSSIGSNDIRQIYKDRSGVFWIGTRDAGLDRFDPGKDRFTHYRHNPDNPASLSNDTVSGGFFEDSNGVLWIGTYGGGLSLFNREPNRFTDYRHDVDDPHSLSDDFVRAIYEDRNGVIWIGTANGGLNRYDRPNNRFTHYRHDFDDPGTLSNDAITSIYEDTAGILWIGTYGGGINRMDRTSGVFVYYDESDGLPDNVVYGILEDAESNLWLSTNKGITRFNGARGVPPTFDNYHSRHGLQGEEFNTGAYFKSRSGEMFFGGMNGLNSFYPDEIHFSDYVPPIVLTDFSLRYKRVPINPEGGHTAEHHDGILHEESSFFGVSAQRVTRLERYITYTKEIRVDHDTNIMTFEFAALHYASPELNRFAYKMEGFENDWTYSGDRRVVTYTNLDPGEYVFQVKGTSSDGVWNEEGTSLAIEIIGPWWGSLYFQLPSIAVFMFLVALYVRYQYQAVSRQNKALEEGIALRTAELELANRAKGDFLATMSHEIRSPMNSILGFSEILSGLVTDAKQKKYLRSIRTSGKTLLTLINDIMDLSKIEAGKIELHLDSIDLENLVSEIELLFSEKIESKGLLFELNLDPDLPSSLVLDEVRIRQVIVNLIDNAIKFTDEGYIRLSLAHHHSDKNRNTVDLDIQVVDTGMGIAEENHETIFESFEQQAGQDLNQYGGTGLGLTVTKLLVEKMGGEIGLTSAVGKGTSFHINLPQVRVGSELTHENTSVRPVSFEPATVLVVDDLKINQELLQGYLEPCNLRLIFADNGKMAVDMARRQHPDMILMDVAMPVMDGIEATRLIKEGTGTGRIPVIAITATSKGHSEKDTRNLFDAYLKKPVSKNDLVAEMARFLDHNQDRVTVEQNTSPGSVKARESDQMPAPDLDRAQLAILPELVSRLEAVDSEWRDLCRTLTINDVEAFAGRMKDLGLEYNCQFLVDWAADLAEQAADFNLVSICAGLELFPDIVAQVIGLAATEPL